MSQYLELQELRIPTFSMVVDPDGTRKTLHLVDVDPTEQDADVRFGFRVGEHTELIRSFKIADDAGPDPSYARGYLALEFGMMQVARFLNGELMRLCSELRVDYVQIEWTKDETRYFTKHTLGYSPMELGFFEQPAHVQVGGQQPGEERICGTITTSDHLSQPEPLELK